MRNIPTITKNLLIINALMFFATFVFSRMGIQLDYILGLHFFMSPDFHIYQLVTYMFMHANIEHIFFNMFALWMFGCVVERVWGPKKFLFYFISCGIGAGLIQEAVQLSTFYFSAMPSIGMTVGASGAIYGILLAFGMLFPEERIFIFPFPVPIKAKWFICLYVGIELFMAMSTSNDGVAHTAHLGGMLIGYLIIRYWRSHPGGGYGKRNRGNDLFGKMRGNWERMTGRKADNTVRGNSDWDYNLRKKREQEEIDRILDKVRRSGYDSLTDSEKKKLFENGKK